MLARLHDMMYGNPEDVLTTTDHSEAYVDRVLNVLGSGAVHKTYVEALNPIITAIFDAPLEAQPK